MGRKFVEMQKDRDLRVQEAARDTYEQLFADSLSIVLHDPKTMGKDTFGYKRISKILEETAKVQAYFTTALNSNMVESDARRHELDGALSDFIPEGVFVPFSDRYDHVFDLVPVGKEKKR